MAGMYCDGFRVTIYNGESDTDFAASHQILQRLRVHASFCLIAAVGMAADVWRNIRHLNAIDIVIFADHVVESMFPITSALFAAADEHNLYHSFFPFWFTRFCPVLQGLSG